jgi:hypothetical protein
MTPDHDDFEPHHSSSPTDQVLHELQLYGFRPFEDEPDPRPLPEAQTIAGSISDMCIGFQAGPLLCGHQVLE